VRAYKRKLRIVRDSREVEGRILKFIEWIKNGKLEVKAYSSKTFIRRIFTTIIMKKFINLLFVKLIIIGIETEKIIVPFAFLKYESNYKSLDFVVSEELLTVEATENNIKYESSPNKKR